MDNKVEPKKYIQHSKKITDVQHFNYNSPIEKNWNILLADRLKPNVTNIPSIYENFDKRFYLITKFESRFNSENKGDKKND